MNQEIVVLEAINTWEVVDLPYGKKLISSKWVYTIIFKVDGTIERFKARFFLSEVLTK